MNRRLLSVLALSLLSLSACGGTSNQATTAEQRIGEVKLASGDKVLVPQHRQRRAVGAKTEASTGAEPSAELEAC